MGVGGDYSPYPLMSLPAVIFFPLPSTIFGFPVTYDKDVPFGVKIPLVFSFTAVRVCRDTTMKGFVTYLEQVSIMVSWFTHFGSSFLDSRRSGCSRHHCKLDTTTY